jgi:hypothetical protein
MKHSDYVAEQMRDPVYRRWHYFYAIVGFPRKVLIGALFGLRDLCHAAALRLLGVRRIDPDEYEDE